MIAILHNIRSAYNVGSMFRTADGAGISKIYLTGHTPAPVDKFGRDRKDIAKVALGAEKTIPWEQEENIFELIKNLKQKAFELVVLEQAKNSSDYREFNSEKETALIVGNEVKGIEKEILDKCDSIIEIPMKGEKESLNVSVAFGIAVFEINK